MREPLSSLDMSDNVLSDDAIETVFELMQIATEDERVALSFQSISGVQDSVPTISLRTRVSSTDESRG